MSKSSFKLISAIALSLSLFTAAPAFAGEANLGEDVFRKCMGCHKVGEGAKNSSGPVLNGIIGRTAGTFEGFRYGDDLVAAGEAGLVWDEDNIQEFIADPRAFLRTFLDDSGARAKMAFRLRKEDDRENVAAYLATQ
ncbi:MAG: c-type cytochrome [Devosiaceae bacterium]|nr:c-type cytochrome [Devosiaceae bacterium]